ncbi:MAG: PAS domain-containing protein [bacterium]|nr:PAS domain-containing protein [bacterium]
MIEKIIKVDDKLQLREFPENGPVRGAQGEALYKSEERLRLALEAADIGIWDWNIKTGRITWSENMEKLLDLEPGSFDGSYEGFINTIHQEDRARIDEKLQEAIKNRRSYDEEYRVLHQNDDVRWIRIRGNVYLDENGEVQRLMGSIHDKTERKLSLDALQFAHNILEKRVGERTLELSQANEKLKEEIEERENLQKEIMAISEREQQRIGQDLHDSLSQQIGGIIYMSQVLKEKLAQKGLTESGDMQKIIGHMNSALKHTRDLSRGLFPVLEKGGLAVALKELAHSMEEIFDIRIHLTYGGGVQVTREKAATHIFRIVQEAVNNAIKHGRASEVRIHLKKIKTRLLLEIADNGAGFPQKPNKKGMGINIMKYRVSVIGGSLEIDSEKGKGTTVLCRLKKPYKLKRKNNE